MRDAPLTALIISPHRELAQEIASSQGQARAFQILGDLKSYPTQQTLELRLRQLKPEVVIIDLATDLDQATQLISLMARPEIHIIGLHESNEPHALIQSLRAGACEFLYRPLDAAQQREAMGRIRRLRAPNETAEPELGRIAAFSSAKPGSGASTLATQTAFALKKISGRRVLLIDCDLMGGTIGFYLKLNHPYSLVDALNQAHELTAASWSNLTVSAGGLDILPAPEAPFAGALNLAALHDVLQYARMQYDWVILDLPAVFQKFSLLAVAESDSSYLVSTSELPSLHLARKAVALLTQLGLTKDRYQVVINRVNKRDNINRSDMEKIFNCSVMATFPNDYFSLHRVVTLGQPLGGDSELGKSIESLAGKLAGPAAAEKRRSGGLLEPKTAYSQA
ncbi:MAG: AAA family ATPase [Bryobacteraceae bacterium]|nr:AAA family ATPase [Bryobacteraceae bacterium]